MRSLGTMLLELQGALPDPPWPEYLFNLLANPLGLNLRNTVAHGLVARRAVPRSMSIGFAAG